MTVRDSEWTEVDRAEVLALAAYRGTFCPCGCGFLRADTMADEKTGPAPSFTADRMVCRARLARLETAAAVDDPNKPPPVSAGARVWTVRMHEPRK